MQNIEVIKSLMKVYLVHRLTGCEQNYVECLERRDQKNQPALLGQEEWKDQRIWKKDLVQNKHARNAQKYKYAWRDQHTQKIQGRNKQEFHL